MAGLPQQELLKRIMAINNDASLSDAEKAQARQDLMSGKWKQDKAGGSEDTKGTDGGAKSKSAALGGAGGRLGQWCRVGATGLAGERQAASGGARRGARPRRRSPRPASPRAPPCAPRPPAGEDKGKGTSEAEGGSSLLDDDTLKCAICFDLCVRPVTVRRPGAAPSLPAPRGAGAVGRSGW